MSGFSAIKKAIGVTVLIALAVPPILYSQPGPTYSGQYQISMIQPAPSAITVTTVGTHECSGGNTVTWQISENEARYKNFLAVLLTAMSTGSRIRWYHCNCNGNVVNACTDYLPIYQ